MEQNRIRAKVLAGFLVIVLGSIFLLKVAGVNIPFKILSWEVILICFGLIHLVKKNFKGLAGYVMIGIGTIFLISDLPYVNLNTDYVWPILIILIGGSIIYKALFKKKEYAGSSSTIMFDDDTEMTSDQYFESSAFFGGVNKKVVSSDFKGAKISSYFGGTEIDLMKADIKDNALIEATCVFGGTTIIVPNDWEVKNEITTILGGIEDKRSTSESNASGKVLVLRGSCIFGGLDIKSYS